MQFEFRDIPPCLAHQSLSYVTMVATKIIVFGDINGASVELGKKIKALNAKAGPFEMVICVGKFFGSTVAGAAGVELLKHDPQYKSLFDVPTYILQPSETQLYNTVPGGEICHNLINLGRSGIITTTSGTRIVYISGYAEGADSKKIPPNDTQQPQVEKQKFERISKGEVASIIKRCTLAGVQTDLLITHAWPLGIERNSTTSGQTIQNFTHEHCSKLLLHVVIALKPRYCFCALKNQFFERTPFRHHQVLQAQANAPVTRFVALGAFNNTTQQKYMYAFNIVPASKLSRAELVQQPEGTTESPFASSTSSANTSEIPTGGGGGKTAMLDKKDADPLSENDAVGAQYFFDMNAKMMNDSSNRRRGNRRDGEKRINEDDAAAAAERKPKRNAFSAENTETCWFCLRRPEVEKHLIVSIGEHCYLALAKGGLTAEHVMILPIAHKQSTTQFSDDEMRESDKFKLSLRKFFHSQNQSYVAFERNYRSSHAQVQIVPVPNTLPNLVVKEVIEREAQNAFGVAEFVEMPANADLRQVIQPKEPYFLIELPHPKSGSANLEDQNEQLFARIKGGGTGGQHFPLNFGREVVACDEILNMPARVDWKACKVSVEEETEMTNAFREKFRPFDFTLSL